MCCLKFLCGLSLVVLAYTSSALAVNPVDTREYLLEFHKNPKKVMNEPLAKWDSTGQLLEVKNFRRDSVRMRTEMRAMLLEKDRIRAGICARAGRDCEKTDRPNQLVQINDLNKVENFLYLNSYLRRLVDMEKNNLMYYTLAEPPWADSFWPVQKGLIARRYADGGFPNAKDWTTNYGYSSSVLGGGGNSMSPAEKYSLLVGDNLILASAMWGKGERYMKTYGFVPGWVGLCHGWSPASIMYPMPVKNVTVPTYGGGSVTFYPSDIKALASLSWGEAPPRVNFVGVRCKKFDPAEDSVGRVTDANCFDVNPGTFHLGIVNQIGLAKRGFVMDSTYDFEVWNYPVYAYQYHYFNPQTLQVSNRMGPAVVRIDQFSVDKFKAYRSPKAKYVVGIALDVTHTIPTNPSTRPITKVPHHNIRYVYDLELDEAGNIIGGEWYSNFHPDFMWNPAPQSRPLSVGEQKMPTPVTWDGTSRVPEELHKAALVSSRKGQPVDAIIRTLVALSQENPPESGSDAPPAEDGTPNNPGSPGDPNGPALPEPFWR